MPEDRRRFGSADSVRECSFFDSRNLREMRRLISILMLAVLGGFYVAPLLQAALSDPESDLPACCRRSGAHHCAIMGGYLRRHSSGEAAFGSPVHCPFYPQQRVMFWSPLPSGVLPFAALYFAELQNHPACHAQTEARLRISFDRSRLKRGPPNTVLA